MLPTFLADRQLQHITRPMPVRPHVQSAVPYFSVVDDAGHLHDGTVRGYDITVPAGSCARENVPVVIRLPVNPGRGRWKLRLGYLANRQTTATVALGAQPPVTMRLDGGLHEIYVSLLADDSRTLTLGGLDHEASVCLVCNPTLCLPIPQP